MSQKLSHPCGPTPATSSPLGSTPPGCASPGHPRLQQSGPSTTEPRRHHARQVCYSGGKMESMNSPSQGAPPAPPARRTPSPSPRQDLSPDNEVEVVGTQRGTPSPASCSPGRSGQWYAIIQGRGEGHIGIYNNWLVVAQFIRVSRVRLRPKPIWPRLSSLGSRTHSRLRPPQSLCNDYQRQHTVHQCLALCSPVLCQVIPPPPWAHSSNMG
jgi:hypothetical protein